MKTKQKETRSKSPVGAAGHLLRRVLYLGAIILICSTASGQNLFVSDVASGNIYEFTPNGMRSTFVSGVAGTLAVDKAGNLFVADRGNIYKITPAGLRSTFASGLTGYLAVDSAGNLFVTTGDECDSCSSGDPAPIKGSGKIYKLTPNGLRTTFASGLDLPTGLAFDSAGNLFVANVNNRFNGAIYKFTPAGGRTTFASGFEHPLAVAVDNAGNLFVSAWDFTSGGTLAIYKITSGRVRSTFALGFPPSVPMACDSAGNLFVSDFDSGSIYKFTPDGMRSTFATGVSGSLAFQPIQTSPRPAPLAAGPKSFANLSTRLRTELGDDVAIGGFIIIGNAPKTVIIRALGPSVPVTGNLADPTLELHDSAGTMIGSNDNWVSNRDNIMWSGLPPKDEHEAAIVTTLSPGSYTAVVRGTDNTSGVALVEVFDLSGVTDSKLANISTRGKVETGDDMMIGGFVIGGDQPTKVIVRAIGPSLTAQGVADALPDPVLQLFNGNGAMIFENDDWRSAQQDQISASGLAPGNDHESAIIATLQPGSYTAVVRGKNDTVGVALVEIYNLETN